MAVISGWFVAARRSLWGAAAAAALIGQAGVPADRPTFAAESAWAAGSGEEVLRGDASLRRGDFPAAIRHLEAAVREDPADVGARDRLSRARRMAERDRSMNQLTSAHFVVRYDASVSSALAHAVAGGLETAYTRVGRALGIDAGEPETVLLYSKASFQRWTGSSARVRALFDGQIHLRADVLGRSPAAMAAALAHEYTHAAVHRLSGGHAPAWVSEGLALRFEGTEAAGMRRVLARRVRELPPLRSLAKSFVDLPHSDTTLAYAESLGATDALIARYGMPRLRAWLASLTQEPDVEQAFVKQFHQDYSQYDRSWRANYPLRKPHG